MFDEGPHCARILSHCRRREEFARDINEKLCNIAFVYDTMVTPTRGKQQGENLRASITVSAERVQFADVSLLSVRSQRMHDNSLQRHEV